MSFLRTLNNSVTLYSQTNSISHNQAKVTPKRSKGLPEQHTKCYSNHFHVGFGAAIFYNNDIKSYSFVETVAWKLLHITNNISNNKCFSVMTVMACLDSWLQRIEFFILKNWFVVKKAKGWISKRVFQDNKARQIFRKNEHFLPPDTHTDFDIKNLLIRLDEFSLLFWDLVREKGVTKV